MSLTLIGLLTFDRVNDMAECQRVNNFVTWYVWAGDRWEKTSLLRNFWKSESFFLKFITDLFSIKMHMYLDCQGRDPNSTSVGPYFHPSLLQSFCRSFLLPICYVIFVIFHSFFCLLPVTKAVPLLTHWSEK